MLDFYILFFYPVNMIQQEIGEQRTSLYPVMSLSEKQEQVPVGAGQSLSVAQSCQVAPVELIRIITACFKRRLTRCAG